MPKCLPSHEPFPRVRVPGPQPRPNMTPSALCSRLRNKLGLHGPSEHICFPPTQLKSRRHPWLFRLKIWLSTMILWALSIQPSTLAQLQHCLRAPFLGVAPSKIPIRQRPRTCNIPNGNIQNARRSTLCKSLITMFSTF